jgi:hypothetical protein
LLVTDAHAIAAHFFDAHRGLRTRTGVAGVLVAIRATIAVGVVAVVALLATAYDTVPAERQSNAVVHSEAGPAAEYEAACSAIFIRAGGAARRARGLAFFTLADDVVPAVTRRWIVGLAVVDAQIVVRRSGRGVANFTGFDHLVATDDGRTADARFPHAVGEGFADTARRAAIAAGSVRVVALLWRTNQAVAADGYTAASRTTEACFDLAKARTAVPVQGRALVVVTFLVWSAIAVATLEEHTGSTRSLAEVPVL